MIKNIRKEKIVHIASGDVSERYVAEYHYDNGGVASRIFYEHQITKKGVPDARSHGELLGVRSVAAFNGNLAGRYALVKPEVEGLAAVIRQGIAEAEALLEVHRQALLSLYAPQEEILKRDAAKKVS